MRVKYDFDLAMQNLALRLRSVCVYACDNGLGELRYLEAERYHFVEAVFGFEEIRRAKRLKGMVCFKDMG